MRVIKAGKIRETVARLCIKANLVLRNDILKRIEAAYREEGNERAKALLAAIMKNAQVARLERIALCQDTGLPCVFVEIGRGAQIGGDIKRAINAGIESGYKKSYLRNSVITDPLERTEAAYSPAVIHFDIVSGAKLKLTVFPKGFGCENKTKLKMFLPTATISQVKEFIIETVRSAGPDACPPYVVGVGIGGTADYACFLAKKALLKKRTTHSAKRKTKISELEQELLKDINKLNIGPMGLGGKATALAVNIETYPTHIAGFPVAVNISCHALRSASAVI